MSELPLSTSCILVIDDHVDTLVTLVHVLEGVGYSNVRGISDPLQTRAVCAEAQPDLVILDLWMPMLDGFAVMRQIRTLAGDSFPPILVVTGDPTPQVMKRALAEGARDFVTKPYDPVELLLRIRNLLETRCLHSKLQEQKHRLEERVRERTLEVEAQAAELARSESRYRALVEQIPAIVYLADQGDVRRILYISPRIESELGEPASSWTSDATLWERRTHPDDRQTARREFERLRDSGEPVASEYRMVAADGAVRWMRDEARLVPNALGGDRPLIQGVLIDITARKVAEEALGAERRLLRAVLDSVDAGIVACDADGVLTLFNRAAREWHGKDHQPIPVLGAPEAYDLFHADGRTPMNGDEVPLYRALQGEHVSRLDFVIAPAGAPRRRVMASGRTIVDEEGRNLGAVVAMTDVTELRNAEAEIQRQRDARHHSEKLAALGTLLAGVAHELNNPLAVVQGQARLLAEAVGDGPLAVRAEKIVLSAARCTRIVRNFLTVAHEHPVERASVDVNRVIRDAVELVAYPLRVESIAVEVSLDPALPLLWADQHQLHQVLVNLITNAHHVLRDSPPPRRLRISSRYDFDGGRQVIEVADTGPGIAADVRERIFEPFFTTKPAAVGTGLGLALCRSIVESHGGTIAVDSVPGQGATFRIGLPIKAPTPAPADSPPTAAPERSAGRRILVVDDEPDVADVLVDVLQAHRVDVAGNGVAALAMLEADAYDLIISDVRMPDMDGPSLYRALQKERPALVKRLAFVTGDSISPDVQQFFDEARVPTLVKPFDFDAVLDLVDRMTGAAPA